MPSSDPLEHFTKENRKAIHAFCCRLTRNREDADDLTQRTLIRAWEHIDSYKKDKPFTNWAYRIAARLHLDLLRYRRRRVSEVSLVTGDGQTEYDAPDLSTPYDEELMADVDIEKILDGVLTPEEKELLVLASETTQDDACARLGIPCGTFRCRLHRIRLRLLPHLTRYRRSEDKAIC